MREKYSINPESTLGILLDHTGGIVIDDWIRLYDAGELNIIARNELFLYDDFVIAEDILGGLFLYLQNGNIGYFAPDCLQVEDMDLSFSDFLYQCLYGDTDEYYLDYCWNGWQKDAARLTLDDGISFYPPLWAQADSLEDQQCFAPMKEILGMEMDILKQI